MAKPDQSKASNLGMWKDLYLEVRRRCKQPAESPTFLGYFLVIVVIIGGFGIWFPIILEIVKWLGSTSATESNGSNSTQAVTMSNSIQAVTGSNVMRDVAVSLYTFYLGLIATSIVEAALPKEKRNPFFMLVVVLGTTAGLFALVSALIVSQKSNISVAVLLASLGYLIALFLWWVGNADNPNLIDTQPDVTTGGNPQQPLDGSLGGFTT